MQVHASCCAWSGLAVLLRGTPGSGKSDLALRLVDAGFQLVADDRVDLAAGNGAVIASPPTALAGLIEVRGLGILDLRVHVAARLGLLADLAPAGAIERLPEPATEDLLGVPLPVIRIDPAAASAVARVRAALAVLDGRTASRCGALGDRSGDTAG
ncbi:HPr kinase/phosphorylase [Elioraea sp.]|jgi:HPr kinase/phosphorylase|uniref:HPr kinase/phosphorylase n=1 Tax=Elioraea sp. TaxID=2185103 RepID=UPI003F6F9B84